jgi:hypothetical protein
VKKTVFCFLLFCVSVLCGADETKQPLSPKKPQEPANPLTPTAGGPAPLLGIPAAPVFPGRNNSGGEAVQETEKYDLAVSGAFINGDTRRNAAHTIHLAQCVRYSDSSISLKLYFKNGLEYTYHLQNPRSRTGTAPGVYREIYDTTIQADREFLHDRYISELYSNDTSIISVTIIGSGKAVVVLNFQKQAKPPEA